MTSTEMLAIITCTLGALTAFILTIQATKHWPKGKFLCDDCKYNDETLCQKIERPQAVDCLAYRPSESTM